MGEGRLRGSVGEASDFGSGHDLVVREFESRVGLCPVSGEPAWDSLSPSLSAPAPFMLALSLALAHSLSLKNKQTLKIYFKKFKKQWVKMALSQ